MSDDRDSRLLQRGLDILEYLAEQREPIGVRELAQANNLSPSTCYRLLQMLQGRHYVRQVEQKRWTLGFKLLELVDTKESVLRSAAHPYLEKLMRDTNETAYLGIRDGDEIVYIDVILSQQAIQTAVKQYSRWPLHSGALGKLLLSALPSSEIERYLESDLAKMTPAMVNDPNELRKQLDEARKNGYAINKGETVTGVFVVAAPLYDNGGQMVAAIGIAGQNQGVDTSNFDSFVERLKEPVQKTARDISERLRYTQTNKS